MPNLTAYVTTPGQELFSGEIVYANIPSVNGYFGVLPGHELLMVSTQTGGILILVTEDENGQRHEHRFLLYEGAAEVAADTVTIIGRFASRVEDINLEEAQKELEEATTRLAALEEAHTDHAKISWRVTNKTVLWLRSQVDFAKNQAGTAK